MGGIVILKPKINANPPLDRTIHIRVLFDLKKSLDSSVSSQQRPNNLICYPKSNSSITSCQNQSVLGNFMFSYSNWLLEYLASWVGEEIEKEKM